MVSRAAESGTGVPSCRVVYAMRRSWDFIPRAKDNSGIGKVAGSNLD